MARATTVVVTCDNCGAVIDPTVPAPASTRVSIDGSDGFELTRDYCGTCTPLKVPAWLQPGA